jgi:hypothetical protein
MPALTGATWAYASSHLLVKIRIDDAPDGATRILDKRLSFEPSWITTLCSKIIFRSCLAGCTATTNPMHAKCTELAL